jgi:hypothetical protein
VRHKSFTDVNTFPKEFTYVERHHAHTTGAFSQGYPPDRIRENSRSILNPCQPVLPANFLIGITHYFIKPS